MTKPTPEVPPSLLSHGDLLRLKRWNTPTIYNGWKQITKHNSAADAFNLEEVRDFMPQMGPISKAFSPSPSAKRNTCSKPPRSWMPTNATR